MAVTDRLVALALAGLLVSSFSFSFSVAGAQSRTEKIEPRDCDAATPNTVHVRNAGGEIQGELTANALKGLLKKVPPGVEGAVGGEYVGGAIGAATVGAFEKVVDHFACLSEAAVAKEVNRGRISEEQFELFKDRADLAVSVFQDLSEATELGDPDTEFREVILSRFDSEAERVRSDPKLQGLEPRTLNAARRALRGITPSDFTRLNHAVGWARIAGPLGTVGACGGVLTGVLEDNHAELQAGLSLSPRYYLSFFDTGSERAPRQVKSILSTIALIERTASASASMPSMTQEFRGCALDMLRVLDPEAAAEAEAEAEARVAPPKADDAVEILEPDDSSDTGNSEEVALATDGE